MWDLVSGPVWAVVGYGFGLAWVNLGFEGFRPFFYDFIISFHVMFYFWFVV